LFCNGLRRNDTLNLCFPIFNGYDPNEKSGRLNVVDSTITYTVQFQNTGNDTAQHIIVRDTLSNDLDIMSLEVLNYSFQPFIQTFSNVAVFNFPNINLVDSTTNEKGSHGFVTFKIKVKPNAVSIRNQGAIYFDFNPPIYTNTSVVSLCTYHQTYSTLTHVICNNLPFNFNGNNLFIAGIYYDTLQNYLGCDSFITLHLNVNQPSSKSINQTICNNQTYNLNGTILTQSGTYYDTMQNHFGCDSFITLHLIVKPISSYSFNQTICSNQPVFIHNVYVNTSGIYHDTLINYMGCDSLITLYLTVKPATNSSFTKTICSNHPYLFNGHLLNSTGKYYDTLQNYLGCDSVITLRLTAKPAYQYNSTTITICEGSIYLYHGHFYTTSTQLYDTFQTQLGCDSIVGIQIITIPAPDTSVVQSGNKLIAQAQHSSYFWYDCTQHQLIQNANDDTFMVYHSGSYAVIVKDSLTLCSDTSNCRTIVVSGVEGHLEVASNQLTVYPNPVNDKLLVTGYQLLVNTIEVTNVLGQLQHCSITQYSIHNTENYQLNTANLSSGTYFIKATDTKGKIYYSKFVKE
jgi:uncharacterized repeat protein (TIGR01451 family)